MPTTIVPDDVLSTLSSAWLGDGDTVEARAARESASGTFDPSAELLRATIDAVFWASLSAEEGRSSLTRVEFADLRDPRSCCFQPRPVSTAALRKLSPLMDVPSNVLYVCRDGNIIGVGPSRWTAGVVAHRPGHLAVLSRSVVLGVFDEGEWVIVDGNEINFSHLLQRALPDEAFPERFLKATLICNLAMAARRAARGATFVLVPADRRDGIGSISYPVDAFPALPEALEAWREGRRTTPPMAKREQVRQLVNVGSDVAAAGAGIDGATLIDGVSLRLLGFGAKINAPDDEFEVSLMELPSTDRHVIRKKEVGGMRHQTAARLVRHNNDATAVTVSQDGTISLFTWVRDERMVLMLKHLDRYLAASPGFR